MVAMNPLKAEAAPKHEDERFSARPGIVVVPSDESVSERPRGILSRWLQARRAVPCECGHPHAYHEHHRPGSDCAMCLCAQFRRV
jgi:hypothetical protein